MRYVRQPRARFPRLSHHEASKGYNTRCLVTTHINEKAQDLRGMCAKLQTGKQVLRRDTVAMLYKQAVTTLKKRSTGFVSAPILLVPACSLVCATGRAVMVVHRCALPVLS